MTMTPEQFARAVRDIGGDDPKNDPDPERTHGETDDLMEQLLIDLGYGAGIAQIRTMTRWYA